MLLCYLRTEVTSNKNCVYKAAGQRPLHGGYILTIDSDNLVYIIFQDALTHVYLTPRSLFLVIDPSTRL